MQRTMVLTGVAVVLVATVGLAFATEGPPNGRIFGSLWSRTARRVKAFGWRARRSPEVIESAEAQ